MRLHCCSVNNFSCLAKPPGPLPLSESVLCLLARRGWHTLYPHFEEGGACSLSPTPKRGGPGSSPRGANSGGSHLTVRIKLCRRRLLEHLDLSPNEGT